MLTLITLYTCLLLLCKSNGKVKPVVPDRLVTAASCYPLRLYAYWQNIPCRLQSDGGMVLCQGEVACGHRRK